MSNGIWAKAAPTLNQAGWLSLPGVLLELPEWQPTGRGLYAMPKAYRVTLDGSHELISLNAHCGERSVGRHHIDLVRLLASHRALELMGEVGLVAEQVTGENRKFTKLLSEFHRWWRCAAPQEVVERFKDDGPAKLLWQPAGHGSSAFAWHAKVKPTWSDDPPPGFSPVAKVPQESRDTSRDTAKVRPPADATDIPWPRSRWTRALEHSVFSPAVVDATALATLLDAAEEALLVARGEPLLSATHRNAAVYLVLSGSLVVECGQLPTTVVSAGGVVGELEAFGVTDENLATVRARTDCWVAPFPYQTLKRFMEASPVGLQIMRNLSAMLADELRSKHELSRQLIELATWDQLNVIAGRLDPQSRPAELIRSAMGGRRTASARQVPALSLGLGDSTQPLADHASEVWHVHHGAPVEEVLVALEFPRECMDDDAGFYDLMVEHLRRKASVTHVHKDGELLARFGARVAIDESLDANLRASLSQCVARVVLSRAEFDAMPSFVVFNLRDARTCRGYFWVQMFSRPLWFALPQDTLALIRDRFQRPLELIRTLRKDRAPSSSPIAL